MEVKQITIPKWFRIFNIVIGGILAVFAFIVLLAFNLAEDILILLLGITMLLIGITRIVSGIAENQLSNNMRLMNVAIGVILIPISLTVIALPGITFNILIIILAVGVFSLGLVSFVRGLGDKKSKIWFRTFLVIYGLILTAFSIVLIIFNDIGHQTLIIVIASALLFIAIRRVAEGAVGYSMVLESGVSTTEK